MTENPLVSIIVPVYKVEAFLDRCVESLLAQRYEKIEIILVDDGSPDACPGMCDAWAEKDRRIQVLHKANSGAADARNQGILLAKGEYVSFVDSDDYVSPDYVEYLLSLLRETGGDLACCILRNVTGSNEQFLDQSDKQAICFDNIEACRALMTKYNMPLCAAGGKMLPRALALANPFPSGRLHEDEATTYKYYFESRLIVLGFKEVYAYYQNPASATHTKTRLNSEAAIQTFEEQCKYFEAKGCKPLQVAAAERLLSSLVYMALNKDEAALDFFRAGRQKKYLKSAVGFKTRLRYYGYVFLRVDLSKLYHKLFPR